MYDGTASGTRVTDAIDVRFMYRDKSLPSRGLILFIDTTYLFGQDNTYLNKNKIADEME